MVYRDFIYVSDLSNIFKYWKKGAENFVRVKPNPTYRVSDLSSVRLIESDYVIIICSLWKRKNRWLCYYICSCLSILNKIFGRFVTLKMPILSCRDDLSLWLTLYLYFYVAISLLSQKICLCDLAQKKWVYPINFFNFHVRVCLSLLPHKNVLPPITTHI